MLYVLIVVLHVVIAFLLMSVVLMQSGRGGAMGSSFGGGGGNQTLFGGRGATTFLTNATWVLGGAFMVTSLALALAIGHRTGTIGQSKSLLKEHPIEVPANPSPGLPGQGQGTETPGVPSQQPVAPPTAPPAGGAGGGTH